MPMICPVCHTGYLEKWEDGDGQARIQCSQYPACRFSTDAWEHVPHSVAHFHHPITPGQ